VPAKSVRPFHVHGPGLRPRDGRIIEAMISKGINNLPIEIQSDGKATRTYGYVSDATIGFLKVLFSGHNGGAFNVGADKPETSILELATVISRLFGRTEPVRVVGVPAPAGSPKRACPDLTKIRTLLNYEPTISLEDGLERTIKWLHAQDSLQRGQN
jgi:UDP-glucuronate decarboxylase